MSDLLAFLAAVVPIVATLWVAVRALLRSRKSKKELKSRIEVERSEANRMSSYWRSYRPGDPSSESFNEFVRKSRLERAGLEPDPDPGLERAISLLIERPLSRAQILDQWVLLGSSAAGVILLALSMLLSSR